MHPDVSEVLFSRDDIQDKAQSLASQITQDYQGKKPIIVGLLKGSIMFMADLLKDLDMDLETDFMDVSSYFGVESSGTVTIVKDMSVSVHDRHIIFVEDIIDTGRTLERVVDLIKSRGAASVRIATMLDKKEARIVPIEADYVGYTIPSVFVIGYGLDYNEKYRNLPYVGILKPSVYA